jgi:hypothetical protein
MAQMEDARVAARIPVSQRDNPVSQRDKPCVAVRQACVAVRHPPFRQTVQQKNFATP